MEIENTTEVEDTSTVETPATNTETKSTDEKRFTQKELDTLIKSRLDREKAVSKKSLEESENKTKELEEQVKAYETTLQKMVDAKAGAIPQEYRKLFDKLSLVDQLAFLAELPEEEKKPSVSFPVTPSGNGNASETKTKPVTKFKI